MRSRSVSVTGATGFLGRGLVDGFHRAGWRVRAIVRPGSTQPTATHADRREAGLHDVASMAAAIAGSDVVVHAAGLVRAAHERAFATVNVEGIRTVAAAVNATGARLVHISSLAAIGPGTVGRPVREDDPPHPVNAYGRSKLKGEALVSESVRGSWLILRPSAVYGPGDRGFLPLVRLGRLGLFPLAAPADMPFTFVFAEDVVQAVVRAAESPLAREALFIGHPDVESAGSMMRGIAASLGRTYRPLPVPRTAVRAIGHIGDLMWSIGGRPLLDSARVAEFSAPGFVCDVRRARERLGFAARVGLAEGLIATVRWYREKQWI